MQLNAKILDNGNLEITYDSIDYDEICEMLDAGKTDIDILLEGFEHYLTNGSFTPFDGSDGNPRIGLFGGTCIAEVMNIDEEGNCEIDGNFWYDGEYAIRCAITEMLLEDKVIFLKA